MLALGDYRPPLDTLALDLKFGARLAIGTLFAANGSRAPRPTCLPSRPA